MSEPTSEDGPAAGREPDAERRAISEVEEELDAQSDGEGLEAEAGRGEETGLAEG